MFVRVYRNNELDIDFVPLNSSVNITRIVANDVTVQSSTPLYWESSKAVNLNSHHGLPPPMSYCLPT
jgi:hypothetical protein